MIKIISLAAATILLLTGCSSKEDVQKEELKLNSKNKYIVTKVVREDNIIEYGQYLEVWVEPYKDNEGDLFDERTLYFWVEEPDFKIGEKLSYKSNAKNLKENINHTDFSIDTAEIKNENNKDLKIELNSDVKRFLEENKK